MAKKNIHTVPYEDGWANKREGQKVPISVHKTKDAADTKGRQVAKADEVEHVIHGKNGKIQDKDSYGNDPVPPRDKKH